MIFLHLKFVPMFQGHDLEQIFSLVLQVLRHVDAACSDVSQTGPILNLCEKFFAIAEKILNWQFSHGTCKLFLRFVTFAVVT